MKCSKCGFGNMKIKAGQYGLFAACDNFPRCRNTMKLNKFLYEVLKSEGINIYGWRHECWKCHSTTMVYTYFINKQLLPYMDEYLELGDLGLGSIKPIDNYLMEHYKTINNNFSKTHNSYCVSNNCANCNALIGNHYVVDDPHDIFDDWMNGDLDKYIVEKIPFEKLNIREEDFADLEYNIVHVC